MDRVFEKVHNTLNHAIEHKSVPKRYVNELVSLFRINSQAFDKGIQNAVLQFLPWFRKTPASERGLKVCIALIDELKRLCVCDSSDRDRLKITQFMNALIKLLIEGCQAKLKEVRLGSVWMLERIFALNIFDAIEVLDLSLKKLTEIVNILLRDKQSQIRAAAVLLAAKLYMVPELAHSMDIDPNCQVRKQAVTYTPITERTVLCIARRMQDKEEEIRVAALNRMQSVPIDRLPVQVKQLATCMLAKDRSKRVRDEAQHLITCILQHLKDTGDAPCVLLRFVDSLDIHSVPLHLQKDFTRALKSVCLAHADDLPGLLSGELFPLLQLNQASPSAMLLTRVIVEALKHSNEPLLESVMLDVDNLSQILRNCAKTGPLLSTQNLVLLTHCSDLGEELSRQKLLQVYKYVCEAMPIGLEDYDNSELIRRAFDSTGKDDCFVTSAQQLVNIVVGLIKQLLKEYESEFCRFMVEVINDIRDPLMTQADDVPSLLDTQRVLEARLTSIDEEIEALEIEKERLVSLKDYEHAFNINERVKETNEKATEVDKELVVLNDQIQDILNRSLILTCETLRHTKQGEIGADISELIQTLIYPALRFNHQSIQSLAMECLGVYCLLKEEECKTYLNMFKIVLDKREDSYMEYLCIKVVFDFFLMFDLLSEHCSSEGFALLNSAMAYLNSSDEHMKALVVEGLAKLLLLDRFRSPYFILAKLLMSFFDPASPVPVKQALHVFFSHYSLLSESNARLLCESFKMVLGAIFSSLNKKSKINTLDLSQLSLSKIFSFIYLYLDKDYLKDHAKFPPSSSFHFSIVHFLCRETLNKPEAAEVKVYPAMITESNFNSFTPNELSLVFKYLVRLKATVKDKAAAHAINRVYEAFAKNDNLRQATPDLKLEADMEETYSFTNDLIESFVHKLQRDGSFYSHVKRETGNDSEIEFTPDELPIKREPRHDDFTNKRSKPF